MQQNEKPHWMSHLAWLIMFISLISGFYNISSRIDFTNERIDKMLICIHQESKDFHGRLCAIEERNKKLMFRLLYEKTEPHHKERK